MGFARRRPRRGGDVIATLAASAALAFAPPLGRPLHYETTERRPRPDGAMRGATLTQEVLFVADPNGYVMTVRTVGYRTTLPPAESGVFDTVMKPMVGTVVRIQLSAGGVPERVIDGAASWTAMLAALRAEIAARPAGDATVAPARTMLAALEATPPETRDAQLIAGFDEVLGTQYPPIAVGTHVDKDHGIVTREADDGETAQYREHTTRDADSRVLSTDAAIAVSRVTGLVAHSLRRTAVAATPRMLVLSERETTQID